jgi:hypothetical protein
MSNSNFSNKEEKMRKLPFLAIILFTSILNAQSTSNFSPERDKKPDTQMSFGNECDKKVKKLESQIKCYKCCLGELSQSECPKSAKSKNSKLKCSCS